MTNITDIIWTQFVPAESKHLITPEIEKVVTNAIRAANSTQQYNRSSNIFNSYEPTDEENECYGCGGNIYGSGYRLMPNSKLYCSRGCWEDEH